WGPPIRTRGLSPGPAVHCAGSSGPQEYQLISTGALLTCRPHPVAADAASAAARALPDHSTARRVCFPPRGQFTAEKGTAGAPPVPPRPPGAPRLAPARFWLAVVRR